MWKGTIDVLKRHGLVAQHRDFAFLCILEFSGYCALGGSEPGLERLGGTEELWDCASCLGSLQAHQVGLGALSLPHLHPLPGSLRIKAFRTWEGWPLLWFVASVSEEGVWLMGWVGRREVSDLQGIPSVIFTVGFLLKIICHATFNIWYFTDWDLASGWPFPLFFLKATIFIDPQFLFR